MAALCNRAGHYIFAVWFHLSSSSSFFFSSPNLSGRRLDVYPTSAPGVTLYANLECRSEMCCARLAANTGRKKIAKKSPSGHQPTTLSVSQLRHVSTIEKNLLSSNMSSTCPHNMVNFGPLAAEICWRVWGTRTNFNWFRVLAALLNGVW